MIAEASLPRSRVLAETRCGSSVGAMIVGSGPGTIPLSTRVGIAGSLHRGQPPPMPYECVHPAWRDLRPERFTESELLVADESCAVAEGTVVRTLDTRKCARGTCRFHGTRGTRVVLLCQARCSFRRSVWHNPFWDIRNRLNAG
jgi:hypothetical protein